MRRLFLIFSILFLTRSRIFLLILNEMPVNEKKVDAPVNIPRPNSNFVKSKLVTLL